MAKLFIFDFDGTLVDSMGFWNDLLGRFLESKNISFNKDKLLKDQLGMTITQVLELLHNDYLPNLSIPEISDQLRTYIHSFYTNGVSLKDNHVIETLSLLKELNHRVVIFSVTEKKYLEAAVEYLGLSKYIDSIYSENSLGISKRKIDSFKQISLIEGFKDRDTYVVEDSIYVVNTLENSDFNIIGIDDVNNDNEILLKEKCQVYYTSYNQFIEDLNNGRY